MKYNFSRYQTRSYIFENCYKHPKESLRQNKDIFSSETYTVPLQIDSFMDSHGSQDEDSSKIGQSTIIVAIFFGNWYKHP